MRNEVKSGIILSVCVILIIVIVYFTTAVFMTGEIGNKKVSKTNNTTESSKTSSSNETSYENMIIASKAFNRLDETYMVIFFSKKKLSKNILINGKCLCNICKILLYCKCIVCIDTVAVSLNISVYYTLFAKRIFFGIAYI